MRKKSLRITLIAVPSYVSRAAIYNGFLSLKDRSGPSPLAPQKKSPPSRTHTKYVVNHTKEKSNLKPKVRPVKVEPGRLETALGAWEGNRRRGREGERPADQQVDHSDE